MIRAFFGDRFVGKEDDFRTNKLSSQQLEDKRHCELSGLVFLTLIKNSRSKLKIFKHKAVP
jgi:hypothetical protein